MNKAELIAAIAAKTGETKKSAEESVNAFVSVVTDALTKAFPSIYDEYNNILIKLLNCNMYVAKVTKHISKAIEKNTAATAYAAQVTAYTAQVMERTQYYNRDSSNSVGLYDRMNIPKI